MLRTFTVLILAFFFVSCSFKPFYKEPKPSFNANLSLSECINSKGAVCNNTGGLSEVKFEKEWWRIFNDQNLNSLVVKALKNNTDLKLSFLRFEQAAQNLGIERSALFPKLNASGNALRTHSNKNASALGVSSTTNNFNLGFNLSYEFDLWGKYKDSYLAASRALKASVYDFEAARLSLISTVIKLYFNSVHLNNQVQILEQTVEDYTASYELKNEQFKVGAISEYELYSYKAQLESAKTQLVSLRTSKDANDKSLMILVSSDLNEILYASTDQMEIESFKVELPQGISSEILLQRPDIRAALERLEQRNYLVGVARTAYLPNISLTGLLGFQSLELNNLGSSPTWNAGASSLMPIFRWGEITYNVNLAKLSKDEAYLNYENVLKTVFAEVRTALIERESAFENEKNYADLLSSQEKIYKLAQIRYDNGSSSLTDLLDARRNYLNAKLSYESSVYTLLSSVVDVIKAFGGGFNVKDEKSLNIKEQARDLDLSFRE
ncbi:TolC family protein [Campylobacter troglodytis]|uniref:TolC family protein n=1 Tax=Campylobacter troglodytis TaxID=654363 RepID=UPI001156C981|nr:TolC family protein [Campylobacter troglodytis]TQR61499.1 TolC family protein [Campylobacter troglodytis]